MIRNILGIVAGVAVAGLLILVLEAVISYALAPAGIDPSDPEGMSRMIAQMSAAAFLALLLTYLAATLAGGFTAARIAREQWAAWTVAGLLLAGTIANVVRYPEHPLWFTVAAVVLIAAGGWFAGRLALGAHLPPQRPNAGEAGWVAPHERNHGDHGSDGGGDGGGGD